MKRLRVWWWSTLYMLGPPPWYFRVAWCVVNRLEEVLWWASNRPLLSLRAVESLRLAWSAVGDARCDQYNWSRRWLWDDGWDYDYDRHRWVRLGRRGK